MVGLLSLPQELIWDIHQLAISSALPLVSTQIFHQLAHPPSSFAARWLLSYHASAPPADLLSRVLRHGVCTLEVFQAVERIWEERKARRQRSGTLEVRELPKRLFRHLLEPGASPPRLRDTLLPFLDYLFDRFKPCPNSHKGYPLCAALTEHPTSFPLTKYLLDKGADPSLKDGYAVLLAIDKRDLDLVRMLVEGGWEQGGKVGGKRKRVDNDDGGADSPKRRKKADRVQITSKMLSVSLKRKNQAIVDYLMARGAVPDLKVLAELSRRGRR